MRWCDPIGDVTDGEERSWDRWEERSWDRVATACLRTCCTSCLRPAAPWAALNLLKPLMCLRQTPRGFFGFFRARLGRMKSNSLIATSASRSESTTVPDMGPMVMQQVMGPVMEPCGHGTVRAVMGLSSHGTAFITLFVVMRFIRQMAILKDLIDQHTPVPKATSRRAPPI